MIWLKCKACGAEAIVDHTDGNTLEGVDREGVEQFCQAHAGRGEIEVRDSYGRTYESPPAGAPS